jgi:ferredoxin
MKGLFKPSTRNFYDQGQKLPDYSFFDWIHGYVYSRWPYLYIGVATGEHRLSRFFNYLWTGISRLFQSPGHGNDKSAGSGFADTYHGKVVLPDEASQLVTLNQDVSLKNLEQVIPYTQARDIIIRNPDHIMVLECPCRVSRANPCHPLDVCLIIGEPFAGFIAEHHPRRSRRISQQEAVEILQAEHRRGHVHHAFFKDAMLGRFYAICNCCSCCCGAMQAWQNGVPMLASSGYVSRALAENCIGCGTCVDFCQFGALVLDHDRVKVDETKCMGCGVCVSKCESNALHLVRDPQKGEPLNLSDLMRQARFDHAKDEADN